MIKRTYFFAAECKFRPQSVASGTVWTRSILADPQKAALGAKEMAAAAMGCEAANVRITAFNRV